MLMTNKLLRPKPMLAIEPCAICGREHVDSRDYRRCAVCGEVFCWTGEPRSENVFGVESRACGSRRDHSSEHDVRHRVEYRCQQHITRSWVLFGADWASIRPLAVYVFLCVAFSITFWALVFTLVGIVLRRIGMGG